MYEREQDRRRYKRGSLRTWGCLSTAASKHCHNARDILSCTYTIMVTVTDHGTLFLAAEKCHKVRDVCMYGQSQGHGGLYLVFSRLSDPRSRSRSTGLSCVQTLV
jgi:hypothetical protein